jgi:hypothetical protein
VGLDASFSRRNEPHEPKVQAILNNLFIRLANGWKSAAATAADNRATDDLFDLATGIRPLFSIKRAANPDGRYIAL